MFLISAPAALSILVASVKSSFRLAKDFMKSEYDFTWEPASKMSGDFVLMKPRSRIATGSRERRRRPPQEQEQLEQVSLENLLID